MEELTSSISNTNYQQTSNGASGIVGPSPDTIIRESADNLVPSGTGAIKKTANKQKRNNRNKILKDESRHNHYESTHNNWRNHYKRNYGSSKFHSGDQNISHDNSDDLNYKQSQQRHDNGFRSTYRQNYGEKYSRYSSEYPEHENELPDKYGKSKKENRKNYKHHKDDIPRHSDTLNKNQTAADNDKNLGYENDNTSDISKPNSSHNFKNGWDRTKSYYNEEMSNENYPPKYDRNGRYKKSWNRKAYSVNEGYSDENLDVTRSKGNGNYRNNERNSFFNQKKVRNNVKDLKNTKQKLLMKRVEIASQRERLEAMIKQRTLECLVCCELLKYNNDVWSCKQCYHILHLKCTQAWAKSSQLENGWRCPACQNVCKDIPMEYLCFCGKRKNPRNEPGFVAHTCGEVCLRDRRNCNHRCSILCHPGPCPDCTILVDKSCGCGRTKQQVMCSSEVEITCSSQCEKLLTCGIHKCREKCHMGDCKPCEEILNQICFCRNEKREVICSSEFRGNINYSCEGSCGKTLRCGNHKCQEICHSGACKPCSKDCSLIKTCFCGKKPLEVRRKSCLDPIPSCGSLCQKFLKCGPNGDRHKCEFACHDGDCPPCNLTTVLKCRCGSVNKEIACHKLINDDGKCERKCSKKRLCGKHKCNQRCCIEIEHICPLPCNRILSCGNHRCDLTCHSGRCRPCMETSFEELYCECGSMVTYPPVPCGTKPPICDKPCSRPRECSHEVNHACHTGPCPPCTILCKKWCYGNHEQRGAIPCHQEEFSCGLPCGKPMSCGRHKCISSCHTGTCPALCKQKCVLARSSCGHPCLAPCHEPPCPQTICKSKVAVTCICGVQKGIRSCSEAMNEIRNLELAQLGEKMMNMSKNQSVDISDMSRPKKPEILKILDCTEECRVMERNRRLAIGLQIRNPDISQKLTPRYSDFMRGWAKKDAHFCQRVHDKLTELVQLAKQSQQKSRSHSFDSMNRDKRQFIHEYCEHFGCDSEAYDSEPNRNVVATALRDKSWLPSMSLLEVIQRENGQRKVPMPSHMERNLCSKSESVTLKSLSKTVRLGVQVNDVDYTKK